MPKWRNWQTRHIQGVVGFTPFRVQVPASAPPSPGADFASREPAGVPLSAKRPARRMAVPTAEAPSDHLLAFLDASPTPYHAVAQAARRLEAQGFRRLDERDAWTTSPGDRRYVVRCGSSIAAFRVGTLPPPESGFRLVGAHTDSPNLRLKPRPVSVRESNLCLDVEVYGSPILATWTDRDLGIAGRVAVRTGAGIDERLVRLDDAVARIPNLAIHLNRGVNEDGLKLDKHRHLAPVLSCWNGPSGRNGPGDPERRVRAWIAAAAGCEPDEIMGFDLGLFDLQPARYAGLAGEFVVSARLDNLASCHAALAGLAAADDATSTSVALLFDHEEVGSESAEGAAGPFARDVLTRLSEAFSGSGGLARAVARSLLVSADMAHAVHPNHAERHDGVHEPSINGGPAIKTNANQRYATDGSTGAFFRGMCRDAGVPCQEFVSRGDLPCGSTIGPIVSSGLGVRTVDVGNPMWSMHSVRETAGRADVASMITVLTRFFGGRDPLPA